MKNIFYIVFIFLITKGTSAQYFSKEFGDSFHRISFTQGYKTSDSGYAIFGTLTDTVKSMGLFVKCDRNGDTMFTSLFSAGSNIVDLSVEQSLADGSFYMLGNILNSSDHDSIAFLAKIDSAGELVWQNYYSVQDTSVRFKQVTLVGSDSLFLSGKMFPNAHYDQFQFLLKMDTSGMLADQLDFQSGFFFNEFLVHPNHDILFAGSEWDSNTNFLTATCLKINPTGQRLWAYSDGGPAGDQVFEHLVEKSNGNIQLVSTHMSTIWYNATSFVYTLDPFGNYMGFRVYSTIGSPYGAYYTRIRNAATGGVVLSEHQYSGWENALLLTDTNGEVVEYMTDLNPGGEPGELFTFPQYPIDRAVYGRNKLFKYDPHIDVCHLHDTVCTSDTIPLHFPYNSLAYAYQANHLFSMYPGNLNVSHGIAMQDDCLTLPAGEISEADVSVFPNPAHESITIHCDQIVNPCVFKLYDLFLRPIMTIELPSENVKIATSNLNPAIYFYTVTTKAGKTESGKLVIQ